MKKRALAAPFVVTIALGGCAREETHRNPPPLPPSTATAADTATTTATTATPTVNANPPAIVPDGGTLKRAVPSVTPPTQNPPPPKPSI